MNVANYLLIVGNCYYYNHKSYNFLDCDWLKKLQFSSNSLAKLLSDSLISQSRSNLKFKSTNQIRRFSLNLRAT